MGILIYRWLQATLMIWFVLTSCNPKNKVSETPEKPNIILIVADDLGYSDLSCYGNLLIETPHLDQLAMSGIRFTRGYAAAPLCSPTRASIVTGLNPARINLTEHIHGYPPIPDSQKLITPRTAQALDTALATIPEVLKVRGYTSAHIGKWHLGGGPSSPQFHGYDQVYGGSWAGLPGTFFYPFFPGGEYPELRNNAEEGDYLTDVLTDAALGFIDTIGNDPFYLSLCFYSPHVPIEGKDSLVSKYQAKANRLGIDLPNPHYAAMVESIDENVGRIVAKVKALGLEENTLIVFTSDNGGLHVEEVPAFAKHTPPTTNEPLRAGKGYIYEGGIREPFIFSWKDQIKAGQINDTPISTNDLLNTFAAVSGATYRSEDGIDLSPIWKGPGLDKRLLFMHFPHYSPQRGQPGGTVIMDSLKYIVWYESGEEELYNLKDDPGETENLGEALPETLEGLAIRFALWKEEIGAQEAQLNPKYKPES